MSLGYVLVTGEAGIGSHTCKLLAAAGIQPIVYDNLVTVTAARCGGGRS
jgi:UDP-arabinose 4-epimerase